LKVAKRVDKNNYVRINNKSESVLSNRNFLGKTISKGYCRRKNKLRECYKL
jgi:hypothetical protein